MKTETENQKMYCVWKYFAEIFWNKELEATQKCRECPADKEYCNLARFIINKKN